MEKFHIPKTRMSESRWRKTKLQLHNDIYKEKLVWNGEKKQDNFQLTIKTLRRLYRNMQKEPKQNKVVMQENMLLPGSPSMASLETTAQLGLVDLISSRLKLLGLISPGDV
ncbi:hypothetical protein N1851_007757 [Merluccius polli]|uniref:Uncharacterized protein n=1 Tax=Merluccius polli TaxID=89951 RepID=A0AA47N3C6_MERPO|nr:hypothetical protein N1851_007757 [Merluccius polli]